MRITSFHYKITAEILLLIPAIFLVVLGIGEITDGDNSGVQHFIELIPFVVLALLGWYYSKIAGLILAVTAIFLAIVYYLFFTDISPLIRTLSSLLLFLPPMIAGIFFFISNLEASNRKKE